MLITVDSTLAYKWSQFVYIGAIFIPITTYHFVTAFLKETTLYKKVWIYYLLGALVFLPLSQTRYFLDGVHEYFWGYWFKAGPLHPLFLAFFVVLTFMSFLLLHRGLQYDISGAERMRRRYLFGAFIIAYLGAVDFPADYGIPLYPFGYLPVLVYIGLFAYAIVRYRLMDIRVAIVRGATFLFVYVPLLFLPFPERVPHCEILD